MHIGCRTLRLQGCSFVSGGRHALEMPSLSSPAPEAEGHVCNYNTNRFSLVPSSTSL